MIHLSSVERSETQSNIIRMAMPDREPPKEIRVADIITPSDWSLIQELLRAQLDVEMHEKLEIELGAAFDSLARAHLVSQAAGYELAIELPSISKAQQVLQEKLNSPIYQEFTDHLNQPALSLLASLRQLYGNPLWQDNPGLFQQVYNSLRPNTKHIFTDWQKADQLGTDNLSGFASFYRSFPEEKLVDQLLSAKHLASIQADINSIRSDGQYLSLADLKVLRPDLVKFNEQVRTSINNVLQRTRSSRNVRTMLLAASSLSIIATKDIEITEHGLQLNYNPVSLLTPSSKSLPMRKEYP